MQVMLDIVTHPLLASTQHGFFTRKGGVSSGVYRGLNCGLGSADQQEAVGQNRARVADAMGVANDRLASVHQVHSADVVVISAPGDIAAAASARADALVTDQADVALSVLTADCQPVLLADRQAGVIGAVHAGWRGAAEGVLDAAVVAMRDLGARDIVAVIGPCISQRAYEVDYGFMERFIDDDRANARFFAGGQAGKVLFDLPGFGLARLRDAGVNAQWCGHCTYGDAERFFSYRRATHAGEPDYGRLISAIMLPSG